MIALIPAKGTSERVPGKNLKPLAGHPLLAYSIAYAIQHPLIRKTYVSTEDDQTADVAKAYGAEVLWRPAAYATGTSPDIDWVQDALEYLPTAKMIAILRPTSPFRRPALLDRADEALRPRKEADSIRAITPVRQHPAKMWCLSNQAMVPLLGESQRYWLHSRPTQTLPPVWVQTSSLELIRRAAIDRTGTLAGDTILPLLTEGPDAFAFDTPADWHYAAYMAETSQWPLPEVTR